MALLEVKNLGISFGGLRAVNAFNVTIEKGQLYGLIGPNGAGKTTVFNLLTGVYQPDEGAIILDGVNVTGKKTIDICKAGIARTFQNIRLFGDMTVLDNVKVGLHNHHSYSTLEGVLRLASILQYSAGTKDFISSSLSTIILVATDCTLPAERPLLTVFQRNGLILYPTILSRIRLAC